MGAALLQHLVASDDLDDTGGVPQVEERNAAVIPPPGHPSGKGDALAGLIGSERAGLVGAEHAKSLNRLGSDSPAIL